MDNTVMEESSSNQNATPTATMTELLQKNNSCDNERRNLRGTLYSGIYDRHRQALFALGSFMRMLRNKKSTDNEVSPEIDHTTEEPVINKVDHE